MIGSPYRLLLPVVFAFAIVGLPFDSSAGCTDPPSIREISAEARDQAELKRRAKLRVVMSRQDSDILLVYLKGSRLYVQGKKLSDAEFELLLRKSRWSRVVITSHTGVHPQRVVDVTSRVHKAGIKDVKPTMSSDTAEAPEETTSSNKQATNSKEKLRVIAARQDGDVFKVFLHGGGRVYVNGKSLSLNELRTLATEMGLARAEVTREHDVPKQRIQLVREILRESGVQKISRRVDRKQER